jgi:hypothetical protein
VQGLVARAFTAGFGVSTTPTSTQVDTFRTQIAAELDMHLGSVGYVVPVVDATFAVWLSLAESEGVAAMVLKAFAPESVVSENGGPVIPAYAFWELRYRASLKAIDDRKISSETAATTGTNLARTYLTDNPTNNPFEDGSTEGQQPLASMGSALREF